MSSTVERPIRTKPVIAESARDPTMAEVKHSVRDAVASGAARRALADAAKATVKSWLRPALRGLVGRRIDLSPARWGLHAEPGALSFEGQGFHRLLRQWGSPLHVVLGSRLRRNAQAFSALSGGHPVEVFYSYKTNPVPGVLGLLHDLHIGAEVISHYELWLALQLGVPPHRIVYNGPAKSEDSLVLAMELGIRLINANHDEEVARLASIARTLRKRPKVGIRVTIRPGWGGQFGVSDSTERAIAVFESAFAHDELEVVALHAHLGRVIESEAMLAEFVAGTLAFSDQLRARTGRTLEILDFGGSLCVPTVASLPSRTKTLNRTFLCDLLPPVLSGRLTISRYLELLVSQVEAHHRKRRLPMPRIFLEPGRAMTGDAQLLLASVLTVKEDGDVSWAVIDAGTNIAECVRHEYHQLFAVNRFGEKPTRTFRLAGPICTPADVTYAAWELPPITAGDSLCIMDSGAYFVPYANSFSFPQPGVVLVDQGKARALRRPETFADLIALDALSAG